MTNRLSIITLFVLATLLTTAGVELFCRYLDQALIVEKEPTVANVSGTAGEKSNSLPSAPGKTLKTGQQRKDYAIISERALFGKVQQTQSEAPPAEAPVLEATSLDLTLLGTISGGVNTQRAIIQDKRKRTQEIYYKGDAIGPALIKEILRGKVILTVRGKDEILLMKEPKSSPAKGKRGRPSPAVNHYIMDEPEPIVEDVIDSEDEAEESNSPLPGDEVEKRPRQRSQRPGLSNSPRKVSFKKKNTQVAEP